MTISSLFLHPGGEITHIANDRYGAAMGRSSGMVGRHREGTAQGLPQNSGGQEEQAGNAIAGCAASCVADATATKVAGSSAPAEAALLALEGGPLAGSLQACASSSAFRSCAVGVMV